MSDFGIHFPVTDDQPVSVLYYKSVGWISF